MVVLFPQWQGAEQPQLQRGAETLATYFADQLTDRIALESHGGITSREIRYFSAIHNQALRYRNLLLKKQPEKILTIGGDCGVAYLPITYLNHKYPDLAVIWIDAHADANTPQSSPSGRFHGMVLRTICGTGDLDLLKLNFAPLHPQQIYYVGLRETDSAEADWVKEENIFKTKKGKYHQLLLALKKQQRQKIYLHFDTDVLEPAVFPFSNCSVKQGLSTKKILTLIQRLAAQFEILGITITETTAMAPEDLVAIKPILAAIKKMEFSE